MPVMPHLLDTLDTIARGAFPSAAKARGGGGSGGGSGVTFPAGSGGWTGTGALPLLDNLLHYNRLPGAVMDYATEAGIRHLNSTVAICLNWYLDTIHQTPPCVKQVNADGEKELIANHPVTRLLLRPNPNYPGSTLWAGLTIDYKTRGNGYFFKVRNGKRQVSQLWYRPNYMVRPVWGSDGREYISGYLYTVNGKKQPIAKEDVIHFKLGIDPNSERLGLDPLAAIDRSIVANNEGETYDVAVLKNKGVHGGIVTTEDANAEIGDKDGLKAKLEAETRGENRGRWLVADGGLKLIQTAFSPEQLALDKLRIVPVETICAAMGLDPMVVGLPSDRQTYSNLIEATTAAWRKVQAMHANWGETLDIHLMGETFAPELYQRGDVRVDTATQTVEWDYAQVDALQPDRGAQHQRVRDDYKAGIIDRFTALMETGRNPDDADKGIYYIPFAPPATEGPTPPDLTQETAPVKGGDMFTREESLRADFAERMRSRWAHMTHNGSGNNAGGHAERADARHTPNRHNAGAD